MRTAITRLCVILVSACGESPDSDPCEFVPAGRVQLPGDDGSHESQFEWWYWTGHLKTAADRWFGFELVFFELKQDNFIRMAHHAITDIQDQSFHHLADQTTSDPLQFTNGIDISQGDLWVVGQDGIDHLYGEVDGYQLDLILQSQKAPVFHHADGYVDYSFGGHTYYYSRERMTAQGTLTIDGQELPVEGSAWFDHQWGEMVEIMNTSWDWFALQLDDDREVMVFSVRFHGQERLRGGSFTSAGCQTTELHEPGLQIIPLEEWTSPHTGCRYPVKWQIETGELTLTVTAVIPDQEVHSGLPIYWEGVALVTGDATGRAFVELNNYCR